jgi:UDP-N-acetylglucosamine acyltransferase
MKHNLTSIDPNARIGKGVSIGPFSTIHGDVEIGDGTIIHSNVVIMDGARIGKNCEIFPGAVISAIPQDLKYDGEITTVEIGNNTTIRECVTINKGTVDRMKTVVGDNCLLMAYVHLGHDVTVGNNCIIANQGSLAGHVTVEDYAILEGIVAVQQFITIGAHSFIAGGSLVRKNVPPYVKAAREPLTYVGVNAIGMRRRGFSDEIISQIENAYRIIFIQNKNVSKALEIVESEVPDSLEKAAIIRFIKASDKGIIRHPV